MKKGIILCVSLHTLIRYILRIWLLFTTKVATFISDDRETRNHDAHHGGKTKVETNNRPVSVKVLNEIDTMSLPDNHN